MSSGRLLLTGIEARGRHGASPGEQREAQRFVIDLDVVVEVGGDSIDDTSDYRFLVRAARDVVETRSFALLETLAEEVARAVYAANRVMRVVAVVHKPAAAERLEVGDVAAEAIVS
ncbi:MAG: dihydroneopterin aldolase [Actinobacteria bacterium]|nr:dihydroneopterin aldolase [Actinomycetota bacterium]